MYADPSRPYADPPSPAAPDDYGHPDQYYNSAPPPPHHGGAYYDNMPYQDQYSAGDFISPERDGRGIPGGRQTTYPPASSDPDLLDKEDAFAYEKPALQQPVTRGSIAAQVRHPPPSYQLEETPGSRADPSLFRQLAAEGQIPKKEGLRMFRKDEHAGALTRGGRMRCCGRVFCCSIMLIVLILVGIVAAFFRAFFVFSSLLRFNRSTQPSLMFRSRQCGSSRQT